MQSCNVKPYIVCPSLGAATICHCDRCIHEIRVFAQLVSTVDLIDLLSLQTAHRKQLKNNLRMELPKN